MIRSVNRHFLRHYAEMVVVMLLGMAVLYAPGAFVLRAVSGWSDLHTEAPGAVFGLMCLTMTAPMVWWMRRRGHGWRPNAEMAMSMIAPTLVAIALLAADVAEMGTLMSAEHVAMFGAMFLVMLARPDEYACHRAAHSAV